MGFQWKNFGNDDGGVSLNFFSCCMYCFVVVFYVQKDSSLEVNWNFPSVDGKFDCSSLVLWLTSFFFFKLIFLFVFLPD